MTPTRKKSIAFLTFAVLFAFAAFYALFAGGTNHAIATGVLILGFLGFVVLFNKGFDLWSAGDETKANTGPVARE